MFASLQRRRRRMVRRERQGHDPFALAIPHIDLCLKSPMDMWKFTSQVRKLTSNSHAGGITSWASDLMGFSFSMTWPLSKSITAAWVAPQKPLGLRQLYLRFLLVGVRNHYLGDNAFKLTAIRQGDLIHNLQRHIQLGS